MTFNRFDYIGLPEDEAYSLAGHNGFVYIAVKRINDLPSTVYEGSSVSQRFNENRITLLVDDTNVADCYMG